jgi:hypothetical protein
MPNLDFYSAHCDHEPIVEYVFESQEFRVFELDSKPDSETVEITCASHLKECFGFSSWTDAPTIRLQLLVVSSGGQPTFRRINLKPGALGNATFRYSCEGWGLIQFYMEAPRDGYLRNSHTNHFSPKKAVAWADVDKSGKQTPADWNWTEVQRASRRLNSFISRRAVEKVGSRPILPSALELRTKGTIFLPLLG